MRPGFAGMWDRQLIFASWLKSRGHSGCFFVIFAPCLEDHPAIEPVGTPYKACKDQVRNERHEGKVVHSLNMRRHTTFSSA